MKVDSKKVRDFVRRWFWPLLLTVVVLSLAGIVAFPQLQNCGEEWTTWPSWSSRLTSTGLPPTGCLTPNEIGDFLAGVFAPLAFVWLAFAVVLQSQELRDQKEILDLTREELKLTRGVAEQQQQALAEQADVMSKTARLNIEQQAQRDLITLVTMITPHVRSICSQSGRPIRAEALDTVVLRNQGKYVAEKIREHTNDQPRNDTERAIRESTELLLREHYDLLRSLQANLSEFDRALYNSYQIPDIVDALEYFLTR